MTYKCIYKKKIFTFGFDPGIKNENLAEDFFRPKEMLRCVNLFVQAQIVLGCLGKKVKEKLSLGFYRGKVSRILELVSAFSFHSVGGG